MRQLLYRTWSSLCAPRIIPENPCWQGRCLGTSRQVHAIAPYRIACVKPKPIVRCCHSCMNIMERWHCHNQSVNGINHGLMSINRRLTFNIISILIIIHKLMCVYRGYCINLVTVLNLWYKLYSVTKLAYMSTFKLMIFIILTSSVQSVSACFWPYPALPTGFWLWPKVSGLLWFSSGIFYLVYLVPNSIIFLFITIINWMLIFPSLPVAYTLSRLHNNYGLIRQLWRLMIAQGSVCMAYVLLYGGILK